MNDDKNKRSIDFFSKSRNKQIEKFFNDFQIFDFRFKFDLILNITKVLFKIFSRFENAIKSIDSKNENRFKFLTDLKNLLFNIMKNWNEMIENTQSFCQQLQNAQKKIEISKIEIEKKRIISQLKITKL